MPTVRQIRWAKFRVLVVAVVATTILAILFYLFTGGTIFEPKATIYVYIPDATGVSVGSPVRVDGIGVGKVSSVDLSGSSQPARTVRVGMSVQRSHLANIPVDSTADLGTDTLLGDKFVGITSGRSPIAISPGMEVPLKPQTSTLDLQQFAQGLRTVDATLRDIENGTSPLGQFVVGEDMYDNLLRRVDAIDRGLRAISNSTGQIGTLLYTDKAIRAIEAPLTALDQSLAQIQSGQGAMGALLRDSAQYDSLQAAFVNLRRTVDDFRSSDLMRSDALYRQWNGSLASMIQKVDQMNASPLFSSSAVYENLNGFASEIQTTIRNFRQDPRKYLRLKVF
jgi:phospholipid/cholesterol/gamma-HCH transport system substrate-binding protein